MRCMTSFNDIRNETPSETAARECYEETLGVLGTSKNLLESLRSYTETNAFKVRQSSLTFDTCLM